MSSSSSKSSLDSGRRPWAAPGIGGSGGTVAVLGRRSAEEAVRAIAGQYARETGRQPYLFTGSSPGAAAFGTLRVE